MRSQRKGGGREEGEHRVWHFERDDAVGREIESRDAEL